MTAFEWVERFNDRVELSTDEHNSLVSLFAQAINEEREACARTAELLVMPGAYGVGEVVAARIRARTK